MGGSSVEGGTDGANEPAELVEVVGSAEGVEDDGTVAAVGGRPDAGRRWDNMLLGRSGADDHEKEEAVWKDLVDDERTEPSVACVELVSDVMDRTAPVCRRGTVLGVEGSDKAAYASGGLTRTGPIRTCSGSEVGI